jgi:demethylmenaquinone methyltransferase/2-methoxy-6-polyprenyl-1,4-benzoquinol methylase
MTSNSKPQQAPVAVEQLPHGRLPAYYRDEAEHQRFLRRIFDETAGDYDRIERVLALGSGPRYRKMALQRGGLKPGDQVVDVGIGTGLLAREACALIGMEGSLVGVDPSPGMLAHVDVPGVELRVGRAEQLPCADAEADFLSLGYAFRHVSDVSKALSEFRRVLRPGGRLLILEISRPESRLGNALLRGYMRTIVPVIARLVAHDRATPELWRYYWDTIESCIAPAHILASMEAAGFEAVRRHTEVGIFSEYSAVNPKD